jgi:hypothetical protein
MIVAFELLHRRSRPITTVRFLTLHPLSIRRFRRSNQPKPFACHTSARRACNPNICHTSRIALLQVLCLPQIRKTGGGWGWGNRPIKHFAYRPASRSSTASESTCPRSIATFVPSGEKQNLSIRSEVKCVSWRGAELSSGCSHKLSVPLSRTTYTTALGSGANATGTVGEARWSKS